MPILVTTVYGGTKLSAFGISKELYAWSVLDTCINQIQVEISFAVNRPAPQHYQVIIYTFPPLYLSSLHLYYVFACWLAFEISLS